MCAHRQSIGLDNLSVLVKDIGFGDFATVLRLDYDFFAETGLLVRVDAVGDVFSKVDVLDLTAGFADDYGIEGVPFADYIAFLDCGSVVEVEFRTVGDVCVCEHHLCIGVDNAHFGKTSDNNVYLASGCVFFIGFYRAELVDFENTVVTRCH